MQAAGYFDPPRRNYQSKVNKRKGNREVDATVEEESNYRMPSPARPDEAQPGVAPARLLFRKMLQGSSLYSLAIVGGALSSVILLPINTRFLDKTDFGVLDLVEKVLMRGYLPVGTEFFRRTRLFLFQ